MGVRQSDIDLAFAQDNSPKLSHAGVKGMKWGVRKAKPPTASVPSRAKLYAYGAMGKKSSYTNKEALVKRTTAGRLRTAAIITGVAGAGIRLAGLKSGNPAVSSGATIVGNILLTGGAGLGLASTINAGAGIDAERQSRGL